MLGSLSGRVGANPTTSQRYMLQKESKLTGGDNSKWLVLKIFNIYKHGFKKHGNVSFITFSSIRKRKKLTKAAKAAAKKAKTKLKKTARPRKTFACILTTNAYSPSKDGRHIKINVNLAANFTRRIIRSKLKVKGPCFFNTRRAKYISKAKHVL